MTNLINIVSVFVIASSIPDWHESAQSLVNSHYESILNGRVADFSIEIRRLPNLKAKNVHLLGVRGDETNWIPRGSRLCWLDLSVGGREKSYGVTVEIQTWENCPVTKSQIPSRRVISEDVVKWQLMNTTKIGATSIPLPEEISEYQAKRNIPAGSLLTMAKLVRIPTIQIGDELDIIAMIGDVEIGARGKALQDGYLNEKVRVENLKSHKRLYGRVIGNGKVIVE